MEILLKCVISGIVYIPLVFFIGFMPYLTKKNEIFGVTIPDEAVNDSRIGRYKRNYSASIFLIEGLIAVTCTVCFIFLKAAYAHFILGTSIAVLFIVTGFVFSKYHNKMKNMKANAHWEAGAHGIIAVDTSFRSTKILVSPLWFFLYFIVIAGTLLGSLYLYDIFPDKIPAQHSFNGEVLSYINKTYYTLIFIPSLQLIIAALMIVVYWSMKTAKANVDASRPEESVIRTRIFRYRWSAYSMFMGLGMLVMFSWLNFSILLVTSLIVKAVVVLLFAFSAIFGAVVLAIFTGQSGSRITLSSSEQKNGTDCDDDRYWKWGMFYYNKNDSSLFIEKRFGIGYTCNFARPASWLLIAGILGIVLTAVIIVPFLLVK
jgi:uncharacterized membrane protein